MIKAYVFYPPDGKSKELTIEMTNDIEALNVLKELVKSSSIQGFLMPLNPEEKESEEK